MRFHCNNRNTPASTPKKTHTHTHMHTLTHTHTYTYAHTHTHTLNIQIEWIIITIFISENRWCIPCGRAISGYPVLYQFIMVLLSYRKEVWAACRKILDYIGFQVRRKRSIVHELFTALKGCHVPFCGSVSGEAKGGGGTQSAGTS